MAMYHEQIHTASFVVVFRYPQVDNLIFADTVMEMDCRDIEKAPRYPQDFNFIPNTRTIFNDRAPAL